jgi:hypothetical protein
MSPACDPWLNVVWTRSRALIRLISAIGLALLLGAFPAQGSAHPPNGVHHAATVEIEPTSIIVRVDLYAGVIAYKDLLPEVDTDGDGAIADSELAAWVEAQWRPNIAFQLDKLTDLAPTALISASLSGPVSTLFLSEPLTILATIPIPTDGKPHTFVMKDNYRWPQSDYQMQVLAGQGTEGNLASNDGRVTVINFQTDPTAAGGNPVQADASIVLASQKSGAIDRIKKAWLWITVVAVVALVCGWLIWARRQESDAAVPKAQASPLNGTHRVIRTDSRRSGRPR